MRSTTQICALTLATLAPAAFVTNASAQTVYTGLDVEFVHQGFTDSTLPANQDRITDSVWITRDAVRGIYNIAQEPAFQGMGAFSPSPVGTRWAIGHAEEHAILPFGTWGDVHLGTPDALIGLDLVLHLIAEDIYIDIEFTEWGGASSGGRFAYRRSAIKPSCGPADLAPPLGVLDLADITVFVTAFAAMEPAADLAAPEGVFDLADVVAFVEAFSAGCP